jgi:ParB-like chromosome segregation protein Spo0J
MQAWPADKIERWPLERLIPYACNARTHSAEQINQIAASIREWGWTNPILVSEDGTIIAGHGRVSGAQRLGLRKVPVMIASGWTDAQVRAYRLADNRLALNAGWDQALLAVEIAELQQVGFDLELTGFTELEIAALGTASHAGLTDPDDAPEPPADPVSVSGDLWVLGGHRLLCGDSTVAADVAKVLGTVRPHLMVTDPPWGVEYDPGWRASAGIKQNKQRLGKVANDDRTDWRAAWARSPTSGMPAGSPARCRTRSWRSDSRCAPRSSGPKIDLRSAVGIITGNTNLAGTRCETVAPTGLATAVNPRCGRFRHEMALDSSTGRRSPSNACGGQSRTTPRPVRRSMSRSAARARPSSRPT